MNQDPSPGGDQGPTEFDPAIYKRAFEAVEPILAPQDEPEDVLLWHYTDIDGLAGVLKSGTFWATDADYLNDTSELRTVKANLLRTAEERHREQQTDRSALLLDLVARQQELMFTTYVVSFSTLPDDLSQWRAYGRDGSGYALELLARDVNALCDQATDAGTTWLVRCQYSTDEELGPISSALLDAASAAMDEGEPSGMNLCVLILAIGAALGGIIHKSPAYKGESEIRVATIAKPRRYGIDDAEDMPSRKLRVRNDAFIPYIEVPLGSAIQAVCAGPKHRADLHRAMYGLRSYLSSVQKAMLPIGWSDHPYRG